MAITPISQVSFGSYSKRDNASIKRKNNNNCGYSQSPLSRTIPAALLLAMTPVNNVNAQNVIKEGMTYNFQKEIYDGKYVNEYEYREIQDFINSDKSSMVLKFTSIDNDDIPEIAKIIYKKQNIQNINYADTIKNAIADTKVEIKVSGLVLEQNKDAKFTKNKKHNDYNYYAIGDFISERIYYDKENPNIRLGKPQIIRDKDVKVPISKEIYNVLADTMGDRIQYLKND